MAQAPDVARVLSNDRTGELVVRVPAKELLKRHLGFKAGQRGAEAQVSSEGKPNVTLDRTMDVEQLGVVEHPLVVRSPMRSRSTTRLLAGIVSPWSLTVSSMKRTT